jgi:hypothetical protein
MARRVRILVVNDKGEVLLATDRTEAALKVKGKGKTYSHVPGGHIPDPNMSSARYRKWLGKAKVGEGISLEDAARIQMESEFGLKLKRLTRLPNHKGKINMDSLNGMYIFEAEPGSAVNTLKHLDPKKGPEIVKYLWWNGKTVIYVAPASRELLEGYNEVNHMGWDMSKVRIHPQTPEELLLTNAVDNTWKERLAAGEVYGTSAPAEFAANLIKGTTVGTAGESGKYGKSYLGRVKGLYGSLENVIDWNKIPESVVSDAAHTIKIPLKDFDNPATALAAKARLVKALGKSGDSLVIEYGDTVMVWRRSRLMREMGGGLAHATPSGEEFIAGTIVKYKSGMPLKEQGLFFSPEPLYAFAERPAHTTAKMGKRPTIYVATKEWIAENTKTLDKIFKHDVEAEAIAPVGTHVPEPKQVLHTRLGYNGQRIDIMLQEPLSGLQRLKLKALGLVEQVQNIYSPVVYLEPRVGDGLNAAQAKGLEDILQSVDKRTAKEFAGVVEGAGSPVGTEVRQPPQMIHTRLGPNEQPVDILLDKRLSRAQLSTLKKVGLVDEGHGLLNLLPDGGKGLSAAQTEALSKVLDEMGDGTAGRSFRAVAENPEGAVDTFESLDKPEHYEMRVRGGGDERPVVTVRRIEPRANESRARLSMRVERLVDDVNTRYISRANERAAGRIATPARGVEGTRVRAEGRTPVKARVPSTVRTSSTVRTPSIVRTPGVSRLPVQGRVPVISSATAPRKIYAWLPDGLTPKEQRKTIQGSVAFAMGELSGKTAYWILYPPKYGVDAGAGVGEGKAFTLEKPEGVTVAPNMQSAYKTVQARGGVVPEYIQGRVGFASYDISRGQRIKFERPKTAKMKPRLSR